MTKKRIRDNEYMQIEVNNKMSKDNTFIINMAQYYIRYKLGL